MLNRKQMKGNERKFEALKEACKEFVRKVESGEAKSKRSYEQMKAALAMPENRSYKIGSRYFASVGEEYMLSLISGEILTLVSIKDGRSLRNPLLVVDRVINGNIDLSQEEWVDLGGDVLREKLLNKTP